jgi:hypothetical protein
LRTRPTTRLPIYLKDAFMKHHKKLGAQEPTQLNQGKRTPDSRNDRESHLGSSNQSQSRRGSAGSPKR